MLNARQPPSERPQPLESPDSPPARQTNFTADVQGNEVRPWPQSLRHKTRIAQRASSNLGSRRTQMPDELAQVENQGINPDVDTTGLSGAEKALLFLVSLGKRHHPHPGSPRPRGLTELRRAADGLSQATPSQVIAVHKEFLRTVGAGVPTRLKGSGAYLRRLVSKALGEGRVADIWSDKKVGQGPVAALGELDTATLMAMLENEHPQTLAVVLAQIDPGRASEILPLFPSDKQAEIVRRMGHLKSVPSPSSERLRNSLLPSWRLSETSKHALEGIDSAAGLIKRMDHELTETLLDQVATEDEPLANELRKALFTFEDLLRVDGRGMQVLLKEVATDQLVLALKTASEDLREFIFGNVSRRAAAMLHEELELLGPVRLSDVEQAQQSIVEVALNLEREKRITITREGDSIMSEVHPISFPIHSDVDESAWLASQSSPVRDHAFPECKRNPTVHPACLPRAWHQGWPEAGSPAGAISDAPPPPTIDPEKERLALAELGHQTAAFTEAAEQLVRAKMNVFREAEGQLARLAVSIASSHSGKRAQFDPSLHESLARAALDTLGDVHGAELVASELRTKCFGSLRKPFH